MWGGEVTSAAAESVFFFSCTPNFSIRSNETGDAANALFRTHRLTKPSGSQLSALGALGPIFIEFPPSRGPLRPDFNLPFPPPSLYHLFRVIFLYSFFFSFNSNFFVRGPLAWEESTDHHRLGTTEPTAPRIRVRVPPPPVGIINFFVFFFFLYH